LLHILSVLRSVGPEERVVFLSPLSTCLNVLSCSLDTEVHPTAPGSISHNWSKEAYPPASLMRCYVKQVNR
jgi:hypothetical protein